MDTYYVSHRRRFERVHNTLMRSALPGLVQRCGAQEANHLLMAAKDHFSRLLPEIPYIGGQRNNFTDTLVKAASLLALYRGLQPRGITPDEFGAITAEAARHYVMRFPGWLRRLIGLLYQSRWYRRRTVRAARASQNSRYPADFVYEVVDGDGLAFDWGINYRRCGIVHYFHVQGADELSPHMCWLDNLIYPAIGIDLVRTGTLAQGCSHCDFRFRTPTGQPSSSNSNHR